MNLEQFRQLQPGDYVRIYVPSMGCNEDDVEITLPAGSVGRVDMIHDYSAPQNRAIDLVIGRGTDTIVNTWDEGDFIGDFVQLEKLSEAEHPEAQGWDVSQPMRLNMVVRLDTDDKQAVREEAYKVSEFIEKMLRERDGAEFGNSLVTEFSIEPDGYVSVEEIEDA